MSRKQKRVGGKPSQIDVVIVTGGRFDMLDKCLNALYREAQSVPLGIFIIDNATPAEERIQNNSLFEYRPELDENSGVREFRSKRLQQPVGFPVSNNEAARLGHSPLILFLNDDVELHEGAIEKIIRTFDTESIGVVGIKLMFPPTSTSSIRPAGKVQHVGMALNIRGELIHPLVGWSPDHPKANVSRDVFSVTGAALAIRRGLFNKIGGFNPIYGMGTYEDVELCVQARRLGQRVFVNVEATGYHYTGSTQEKNGVGFPIGTNKMTFQAKWGPSGMLYWNEQDFW